MPPPNLDNLPIELLQDISDLVNHTDPPALHAISLTSRNCRRAASAVLFRNIHVQRRSTRQLDHDVGSLINSLQSVQVSTHVRQLRIKANPSEPDAQIERVDAANEDHNDSLPRQRRRQQQENGRTWSPLARLVESLPMLKDLIWTGDIRQLPASLLAVLQSDAKRACRLHLDDFRLHSLIRSPSYQPDGPEKLHPDELELLGSPNLYAITVCREIYVYNTSPRYNTRSLNVTSAGSSTSRDSRTLPPRNLLDYNTDAMPQIASFVPNLKELVCTRRILRMGKSVQFRMAAMQYRPSWPGLTLQHSNATELPQNKAKLATLKLGGQQGIQLGILQGFDQYVDFSTIQTLRLVNIFRADTLEWLKSRARFPSLSALHAATCTSRDFNGWLYTLPPLHTIDLEGYLGENIPQAIIDHHGTALRRLSIPGHEGVYFPFSYCNGLVCSTTDVQELVIHCPSLEELTITISRSGGSEETALYQALGTHSRLQKISLVLDCTVGLRGDSNFEDPFDQEDFDWPNYNDIQAKNGHVRQSLIACAVDRSLIKEIFQLIATSKPSAALQLQRLEIQVANAGKFQDGSRPPRFKATTRARTAPQDALKFIRERIYSHFARRWVASRCLSSDCSANVAVEEIAYKYLAGDHLEQRCVLETSCGDESDRPFGLGCVEPHFRVLWPEGTTGDPRNDWHSFPLSR